MSGEQARELCRKWFLETLEFVRPARRLREVLRASADGLEIAGEPCLSPISDIRVVSIGKAAVEMAGTAAAILKSLPMHQGSRTPLRGVVAAPVSPAQPGPAFRYFSAGHPYPNEQSLKAADAALELLAASFPQTLALFLISGGGSALLEKPLDASVSLHDLRSFYQTLVTSDAGIQEINVLRKHLSAVKGGRLAERAAPAPQFTLYVSDVPEDFPSAVASGPTMPDESTVADCRALAARYGLHERFPASIRALLESDRLPETPKPGHPCFSKSRYHCLLSNRDAVEKAAELARAAGALVEIDNTCDGWHFERAAHHLLARLEKLRRDHPGRWVVLVSGGELSSPVTGAGLGGRNQAFVLACVPLIAGQPLVVLSAGTDGIDGSSPAAGAVADGTSAARARSIGMDPAHHLRQSDSFRFFEKLGDTIITGPAGTNVRDVRILVACPPN